MLRIQGLKTCANSVGRIGATGFLLAVGVAAGGCSTDFRRLEQPSLGINERPPLPSAALGARRNAGAPITQETWQDSGARAPLPPVTSNPRPAFDNAPSSPGAASLPSTAGLSKPFDRPKPAVAAAPAAGARSPLPAGETVDVQAGDTLYALSKRHNVSIAALMELNQLKSPNLKPGQKIVLPSNARRPATKVASAGSALPPSAIASPQPAVSSPAPAPQVMAPAPIAASDWSGSYTLKPGDSLYAIARNHKVTLAELQRNNTIADPTKVRPGTVLKVPGGAAGAVASATPTIAPAATDAPRATQIAVGASAPPTAAPASGVIAPKIINVQPAEPKPEAEKQVAAVAPTLPPSAAAKSEPAVASGTKFRWPVKGQIVANFGKRPDGSPNDGVSIGVPAGTDVHAAQDGTVAYAGSELKGYGNLILVRHDGGWVTAYAHASEILVKRGDAIKRGQVIAKSGQTGGVDKPLVHFELRKDSKPLDPTPYMEKM
jgi:murein DD-endopeptidase MepM/ murein hydrolase activator NlpD